MLIGTAVCGKPHVRWCERAGEIKPSPLYSILPLVSPKPKKDTKTHEKDVLAPFVTNLVRIQ